VVERNRMLLLLAAPRDDVTPGLRIALADEAAAALGRCPIDGASFRVAARVPPSGASPAPSYDQILERGLANGVMLGGFSAVLELSCPAPGGLDGLAASVDGIAGRLGPMIDRERSRAVAGTDVVILDGGGPLQLFYCMRRSDDTTHEAFCEFWAQQHTKIATTTPGLTGYRQLHADLECSRVASDAAGVPRDEINGVALEWFRAMEGFVSAVGGPAEFTTAAKASEEQFNDLGGATAIIATVLARGNRAGGQPW
jgi:hypothetical protein